ncbi:tetratricopeptide repeat protein [Kitasatospora sp. NPDC008050]|uniref:tetratricopeptide repeat protein n=1 Tax=Kitasatospora sp. NPDC008050 TaxID=3364021 RepID=UPI0036E43EAF
MSTAPNASHVPPIEVPCPQCAVPAEQESLRCPSCREDLAALVRLRYTGRIDYNEALTHLRSGDTPAALALLRRALTTEPDLRPALTLLADLTARAKGASSAEPVDR